MCVCVCVYVCRSATSPALFNRCVIDWFGEWSHQALYQVGYEFTCNLDLGDVNANVNERESKHDYKHNNNNEEDENKQEDVMSLEERIQGTQRDLIVRSMVFLHESVGVTCEELGKRTGRSTYVTPRHFLDFIAHYAKLFTGKCSELEEQQRHLKR